MSVTSDNDEAGEDLPPEVVAKVQEALDDGVFLHHAGNSHRNPVDRITWHLGLENALARVIIAHCHHPVELVLDGCRFTIAPVPAWYTATRPRAPVSQETEVRLRRAKHGKGAPDEQS
jgi:hypothetical protein